MKKSIGVLAALVLASPLMGAAQQPGVEAQIAEAVSILPEDLRGGATVVTYDPATGARKVLREGTNFLECQPKAADGFERCYNKTLAPRRDLEAKLRAQKKTDEQISQEVAAAVKAGTLPPPPKGTMNYRGYDKSDRIQKLWVWSTPNSTPESVGVSAVSQRDAAIKGEGLPWMMLPGTPGSHIMIPINPAPKTSKITDEASDEIAQATLPLPEDLRAGATVYKYIRHRRAPSAATGHQPGGVHATRRRWLHVVLQQDHRPAARLRREAAREEGGREADPAHGLRSHQERPAPRGAFRRDVVSAVRQARSHPAALGALGAQRNTRIDRRDDGQRT